MPYPLVLLKKEGGVSIQYIWGKGWCGFPLVLSLPDKQPEWLMEAVLARMEKEYNILLVHCTETVNWWGFSLELKVQMTDKDIMELPDEPALVDRRRLNVIIRCLSQCHNCKTWWGEHIRKDRLTLEHSKNKKVQRVLELQ